MSHNYKYLLTWYITDAAKRAIRKIRKDVRA